MRREGNSRNPDWLTLTKVVIPYSNLELIQRSRVLAEFERSSGYRCVVVTGPVGIGKTSILLQLAMRKQASGEKVAWVHLDEEDTDPVIFLSCLIYALVYAGVECRQLELYAQNGFPESKIPSILALLSNSLGQDQADISIVLDDYHDASTATIDRMVSNLIEYLPANVRLFLSARKRPNIDLARNLVSGRVKEIGSKELLFDYDEARHAFGEAYTQTAFKLVYEKTEGWPVLVSMARLLSERSFDSESFTLRLAGGDVYVSSYLTDQVIESLSEEAKALLVKTSILKTFNAGLANAVCDIGNASYLIGELAELRPLLCPVNEKQEVYRCHNLLREYLQGLIECDKTLDKSSLYLRAAQWYEQQGNISRAIHCFAAAGEYARCAALIENAGGWELAVHSGASYLRTLIRSIPGEDRQGFPGIQLSESYLLAKEGRYEEASGMLEATWGGIERSGQCDKFRRDYEAVAVQVLQYADQYGNVSGLREVERIQHNTAKDDFLKQGVVGAAGGLSALAVGEFARSRSFVDYAARGMRRAACVSGQIYIYIHDGNLAFYQGNLPLAMTRFEEALIRARQNFADESSQVSISTLFQHYLKYWMGDESESMELNALERICAPHQHLDMWLECYAASLELAVDRLIRMNKAPKAHDLAWSCEKAAEAVGLDRLVWMARGARLYAQASNGALFEQTPLVTMLEAAFPLTVWSREPSAWRPYSIVAQALSKYWSEISIAKSIAIQQDAVDMCRKLGALPFLVRSLVDLSELNKRIGQRQKSQQYIREALGLAVQHNIRQPFVTGMLSEALLKNLMAENDASSSNILTFQFLRDCISRARLRRLKGRVSEDQSLLTTRELEVMLALSEGLSNKEISRRLGLTGHTVKFHLRNIFEKFQVSRRGQAVQEARNRGILS